MNKPEHKYLSAPIVLLVFCCSVCSGQATYQVEFDATWSAATHPTAYPRGAHFSPLIGATHDASVSLWQPGGMASSGIEQMAETGGTSILRRVIGGLAGADQILSGSAIGSPQSTTFEFNLDAEHSLVSLVTMVAPSPDWFVGVHDLDLRPSGRWTTSQTIDLFAYDAGTDSGPGFVSSNQDTNPQEPIALLGSPFSGASEGPLGTFTFTLIGVPEPSSLLLGVAGGWLLLWRRRQTGP